MSSEEEDILSKMDALLKRHHSGVPVHTDIPMLDDVVAAHPAPATSPTDIPVLTSIVESGPAHTPEVVAANALPEPELSRPLERREQPWADNIQVPDAMLEVLLKHFDQRMSEILKDRIAPQLAATLDHSLASLMDQFSVHFEQLIRDAITQELQKYLENLAADLSKSSNQTQPQEYPPAVP